MDDITITPKPHGISKAHHVAAVLRDAIRTERLPSGAKVPTAADLSQRFGYDNVTVLRGYAMLRQEGLLSVEQGRGTFVRVRRLLRHPLLEVERIGQDEEVAAGPPLGLFERGTGVEDGAVEVEIEYSKTPAPEGLADDIDAGTPLLDRRYLWIVDGQVHQEDHSYLPYDLAEGTHLMDADQERPGRGTLAQLREIGVRVDGRSVEVSAHAPSPEEATLLRIKPTTPILASRRRLVAQGRTVCVADSIAPSDQIMYTLDTSIDESGETTVR